MKSLVLGVALAGAALAASPVADAAKAGNKAQVLALIEKKADVNEAQADGTTALHWAVRAGDADLTARLLKAGAKASASNRYGVSPLYLAVQANNTKLVDTLLDAGADANAVSSEGETALMTAAHVGGVEVIRSLVKHGAKLEAREEWHGETALMFAAAQRHPEAVAALIDAGADVNARSSVDKWERQQTMEPREKWLPPGGFTPLLFAARQNCLECARILIAKGARLNDTDPDGISPIVSAIINGHYDVAAFLIEQGSDISLADKTGRTALYAATEFNTMPASNRPAPNVLEEKHSALDLIRMLIAKGANVNVALKSQIPYRTKLDRGDDTMLTTGTTPLIRAGKAADVEAMKTLLGAGADAKAVTRNGVNALMAAAGLGTKEEDNTGRLKTEELAIEAIDLCLKAGADINAVDSQGRSALHGASLKGYDKVVKHLAEQGAKLDLKDRRGFTALDLALGKGGGVGFDGNASDVHQSTADLLKSFAK